MKKKVRRRSMSAHDTISSRCCCSFLYSAFHLRCSLPQKQQWLAKQSGDGNKRTTAAGNKQEEEEEEEELTDK
jgi:hypothetical protein